MDILDRLQKLVQNRVRVDEPLARHTSLKVGGPASYFLALRNIEELTSVIEFSKEENLDFFILGEGTNVLFPDKGFSGLVIQLKGEFEKFFVEGNQVTAGAGVKLNNLVEKLAKRGLAGLELVSGIPGSVGGAIVSNAGMKMGWIGDVVREIRIFSDGEVKILNKEELGFSYRHCDLPDKAIVLEVRLGLKNGKKSDIINTIKENLKERKKNQPVSTLNAGCVFRNPGTYEAGKLIESAGLKGARLGDAEVSKKHANFIINCGRAKAEDVRNLIEKIQRTVKEKFDIDLELELKIVKG
ncbi:MAG: UDP-N-acetylmuramate dehydrogenase [Elusimicrobiota bacterium]|nr:UDP-N-acetylmuramate dehydrogenase [Elusimicrobiota bacterium]MDH5662455.1 UDP-N-acetylmuramate dehydrogenase [Elusimicrobiota bacterium]